MKKKRAIIMIGFAATLGFVSCTETVQPSPVSAAGRIVSIDSVRDCVMVDTSRGAITRNVSVKPTIVVTGLFGRDIRPKKDDILFFSIDSTTINQKYRVESFVLFSCPPMQ